MRPSSRPLMRCVALFALVGVIVSLTAQAALAQEQRLGGKLRSGSDVVVPADETIPEDLYVFGGNISIQGRVEGDLVSSGGQVAVGGEVAGDVVATGGTITVAGDVGGDVRAAGGRLSISGSVGEDVLVASGQVSIASPADIGGDLVFASGDVALDGRVSGSVLGGAGSYERTGTVGGSEQVSVDRDEPKEAAPSAGGRVLGAVRRYIAVMLVGALLLLVAHRTLYSAADAATRRSLPALGLGVLAAVALVVGIIALFVVAGLAAILFGLLGLGSVAATLALGSFVAATVAAFSFALVAVFVADVVAGVALGRAVLRGPETTSRPQGLLALAVGAAVLVVLSAVPLLGGIVKLLVVLAGLGALVLVARGRGAATEPPGGLPA